MESDGRVVAGYDIDAVVGAAMEVGCRVWSPAMEGCAIEEVLYICPDAAPDTHGLVK